MKSVVPSDCSIFVVPVGSGVGVRVAVGVGLGVGLGVKVGVEVGVTVANGLGRLAAALQARVTREKAKIKTTNG